MALAVGSSPATFRFGDSTPTRVYLGEMLVAQASGQIVSEPKQVVIRGAGYVTGLSVVGTSVYCRTDVGGAYRFDPAADMWLQLIAEPGVPSPARVDYTVEALAAAPSSASTVYLAAGNGPGGKVLRSTDSGTTWARSAATFDVRGNAKFRIGSVRLAVHPTTPTTVLFGTRTDGLHRSTDSGNTFTKLTGLPAAVENDSNNPIGVSCVAYDPTDPTRIYAAIYGVGIRLSTDSGASWGTVVHARTDGWCQDMRVTPTGTLLATMVATFGGASEVVRWTKPGVKTLITPPSIGSRELFSLDFDPTDEARIFIAESAFDSNPQRFFRTTNGTAATPTWADISPVGGGVLLKSAGAKNTTWVNDLTRVDNGQIRFTADGTALWIAQGFGMWHTTDLNDAAGSITFRSDGIEELVSNRAHKVSGKPLLTVGWDLGIWQHPDPTNRNPAVGNAAKRPHPYKEFSSGWDITASPTDPLLLAAVLTDHLRPWEANARQSARSTDGGDTWTRFASQSGGTHPADLIYGNIAISAGTGTNRDKMVWVPSETFRPYYTADAGATWTASTMTGALPGDYVHPNLFLARKVLLAHPTTAGTFFILGGGSNGDTHLWRSTDGGATFAKLATTGFRAGFYDMRYNSQLLHAGGFLFALSGQEDSANRPFFRASLAAPQTWTQINAVLDAHDFGVGAPLAGQTNPTLFTYGKVGGTYGFWHSSDLGVTWTLNATRLRGMYQRVTCLAGDPEVAGRYWVGYSGNGYVQAQIGAPVEVTPPPPPAPLDSYDFEDGTTQGFGSENATGFDASATSPITGTRSLRSTATTAAQHSHQRNVTVAAPRTGTITVKARQDVAHDLHLIVLALPTYAGVGPGDYRTAAAANTVHDLTMTYTLPEGATGLEVKVRQENAAAGSVLQTDDYVIT